MFNTEDVQVLENLLKHKAGQADGLKIGLVIQGGGMRGAFAAGVLKYIGDLGLSESFDIIYTASSGCNNAVWFVANKNTERGLAAYWEEFIYFNFIHPWNLQKTLNLDLIKKINTARGLDLEAIRKSKTLIKMYVTNAETGQVSYFTNHQNVNLNTAIKASSAYPGNYPPVEINGQYFLDGNVTTILPVEEAIRDHCTDILVITTVTEGHIEREKKSKFIKLLKHWVGRKLSDAFIEVRKNRIKIYNNSLDIAFGRTVIDPAINIYTISPEYRIPNAEMRPQIIKNFAISGIEKSKKIFNEILNPVEFD